jgi:hypothetical protein
LKGKELMKVLVGFILGLLVMLLVGAATIAQEHIVQVSGKISNSTITYQSAFSGITAEGECYLAITNTETGHTELFKITKSLDIHFNDTAFQRTSEGRSVAIPLESPRR